MFRQISCIIGSALLVLLGWVSIPSHAWTIQAQSRILSKSLTGAVCCWTLATAPAVAGDIAKGQKVFEANCMACHAGGQNMIVKEKTLQKDALERNLGTPLGLEEVKIKEFVQNSMVHRGAFILGNKLSDTDFENVVSYVVDQANGDKWCDQPSCAP